MKVLLLLLLHSILFLISCSEISKNDRNAVNTEELKISNEEKEKGHHFHRKLKIDSLPNDLLFNIGSYLINPVTSLGRINRELFKTFHETFTLKQLVMQRFSVLDVSNVDENEPELIGILDLSWSSLSDPFILIAALMEDLVSGKKPYKILSRPLISYFVETCKNFQFYNNQGYVSYFVEKSSAHIAIHLANICLINGHGLLDLVTEIPGSSIACFASIENRELLLQFFQANPLLAMRHQQNLINNLAVVNLGAVHFHQAKNVFKWIGECIIYNASTEFFTEILTLRPLILQSLISSDYFITLECPEYEYQRILYQIRHLLHVYLSQQLSANDFAFANLLNDIRFGSVSADQLNLSIFDEEKFKLMAKAALSGNKTDIFHLINENYRFHTFGISSPHGIVDSIVNMIELDDFYLPVKVLNEIFKIFAVNPDSFKLDKYLKFLLQFYALEHLKIEGDRVYFEFSALDESLNPPVIRICRALDKSFPNFVKKMFSFMKVATKDTLTSLMIDYKNCPKFARIIPVSFEVTELIALSPDLTIKFFGFSLKLGSLKDFKKYLDLPNFERTSHLIEPIILNPKKVTELKTKEHFKRLEIIQKKTVASYFLEYENSQPMNLNEIDYFEWRRAFAFWIKGDQKQRIREINSFAIINMLRREFPEDMQLLLQPESEFI
jgi:hypothetical protein